eukprot:jgi/Botrbrau1/1716/Bobra.116_2s0058.1
MKGFKMSIVVVFFGICIAAAMGARVIPVTWTVTNYPPATATVGDTVNFTWTGTHDLRMFDGAATCEGDENGGTVLSPVSSPGRGTYTFTAPGVYTFLCTVGNHCQRGQIVTYTVAAAS